MQQHRFVRRDHRHPGLRLCRGGRSKPLLPDRRHDSARPWQSCPAVGNQTRIYALRPEARSRLNTVLMVSYFLGGASGAILGGLGAHLDAWIGLAAVGAMLGVK